MSARKRTVGVRVLAEFASDLLGCHCHRGALSLLGHRKRISFQIALALVNLPRVAVFVVGQADPLDEATQNAFPKEKKTELLPPSARPQPM